MFETDEDKTLVRALGDMIRHFLDQDIPIIMGWVNRVSRPAGPGYVLITPMSAAYHATTIHEYASDGAPSGPAHILRPKSRTVQLDFYGARAQAYAHAMATLLPDVTGCGFLASYGLTPLYVNDPQNLTGPQGNEQACARWMLEAVIQVHAPVAVTLDYFQDVTLKVKCVDTGDTPSNGGR